MEVGKNPSVVVKKKKRIREDVGENAFVAILVSKEIEG